MYNNWNFQYSTQKMIDAQTAARIAMRRVPGTVINVELDRENGRMVYEVSIMTNLGVYEVEVDAFTGSIIKIDR